MRDDDAWFATRRYGYGAGWPLRWQGWALLAGFLGALLGSIALLRRGHPGLLVIVSVLWIGGFSLIAARHTRGGWRWRWGED